jgi:hypothetical protein
LARWPSRTIAHSSRRSCGESLSVGSSPGAPARRRRTRPQCAWRGPPLARH